MIPSGHDEAYTTLSPENQNTTGIQDLESDIGKDPKVRYSRTKDYINIAIVLGMIITLIIISGLASLLRITNAFPQPAYLYDRAGTVSQLIAPSKDHFLDFSYEARKSSKKLYELLSGTDQSFYDDNEMTMSSLLFTKNTYSRQPYVANGYIGSRIPNIGFGYSLDEINLHTDAPGALQNGWPLHNQRFAGAFVSDFYCLQEKLNATNFPELDKNGYATVIAAIPQWTDIRLLFNNTTWFTPQTVNTNEITNYQQNLSMKDGIVTTTLDWLDGMVNIKSQVLAHRELNALGIVTLVVSLNEEKLPDDFKSLDISVYDILDFGTAHRAVLKEFDYDNENKGIYMVVEPENVPYSNTAVYSTLEVPSDWDYLSKLQSGELDDDSEQTSQKYSVTLNRDNKSLVLRKYVGIVSTELERSDSQNLTNLESARDISLQNRGSFNPLLLQHKNAWDDLYNDAFIEIPSDNLLELTARSSLYHLLANTRSTNISKTRGLPTPVSGLSSDSYGGMVFWDSDVWMQPALLPFFPNIALEMFRFRNSSFEQARENARVNGFPGAVYPWTAGRFSNCTSAGPCIDYEYHINVDIALAAYSLYLNGEEGADEEFLRYSVWPLIRDFADFFKEYVQYNETLGLYETHNLTDPDEYANHVNNGAFTNAGIKTLMTWATDIGSHLGEKIDAKWMEISNKIYIPRSSSNITLEYSGMNSSVEIKQADVVLMTYPLGYVNEESVLDSAIRDLYYYSEKQASAGPAMTYPVFVAAAAGLLNHGSSSQSYLYKSVLPYLRGPFAQFSEQSDDNFMTNGLTHPAFPFLTANGGFLQSILFGLTGIRYTYDMSPEKKIQRVLKFNPVELPLLPGGIAIRNFKYMNQVLDVIIGDKNATIVHKSGNEPIKIKIPNRDLINDRDVPTYPRKHSDDGSAAISGGEAKGPGSSQKCKYFTLRPNHELTIPLYKQKLNIQGSIAENRQATNLTAGVPGDVAIAVTDGNNYTHWQAFDKRKPGKLLIDLGEDNQQVIKSGLILWGQRPAKNLSISILPHTQKLEQIFANITEILEDEDHIGPNESVQEVLQESGKIDIQSLTSYDDPDVKFLLDWKTNDLNNFIVGSEGVGILNQRFVKIVDNLTIEPSEPYYEEILTESLIEILPSNKTMFTVDYDKLGIDTESRQARFLIISIEGSYDDDSDTKGATLSEVALF